MCSTPEMETESSSEESMMDAEKSMPKPTMPDPSMPGPSMSDPSMPDPSMLDPSMPNPSMLDPGESKVDPKNSMLDSGESTLELVTLLDPRTSKQGETRLETGTSVFGLSRLDPENFVLDPGQSTLDRTMSMSEPFMFNPKKSKLDPGKPRLSPPRKLRLVQRKSRFDPGYSRPNEASISAENNDLDVVNLSSQILALGIVSQDSKQTRKVSKHVRFMIPEEEHEDTFRTGSRRRKSPEIQCQPKKRPVRKTSSFENDTTGRLNDKIRYVAPPEALAKSCFLSAGDKPSASEPMELCDNTSLRETMNKNDNCSICRELVKEAKYFKHGINKSRSDSQFNPGQKLLLHRRFIQKRKEVVSKKYCLQKKLISKPKAKRCKRKHSDNPKGENAKKRKVIIRDTHSERKITQIGRPAAKFVKGRECSKSKATSKSRSSPPKAKSIKYQDKKVLPSKSAKQKYPQKRLKQRLKRTAMKKLALKQKNRGLKNKRKPAKAKRKTSAYKKKAKKRERQIKPQKRRMDLFKPMRILLLKSLTFKTAEEKEYECCRLSCWDDWEEVDIDDLIDEHD